MMLLLHQREDARQQVKIRTSWKLLVGIGESSKDSQYAHCSLCKKDFSVAHDGVSIISLTIYPPAALLKIPAVIKPGKHT